MTLTVQEAAKPTNLETIKKIIDSVSIPVQLGGGIRTMEDMENLFSLGVGRVILGTSAVKNKEFVKDAVKTWQKNSGWH